MRGSPAIKTLRGGSVTSVEAVVVVDFPRLEDVCQ